MKHKLSFGKLVCILLSLVLYSCDRDNNRRIKIIESEGLITKEITHMALEDISTTILEIPLETSDSSLIKNIRGIKMIDKQLFIIDNSMCKIYDLKGNFIKNLGAKGKGPNEYLNIGKMFFGKKNIWLYDSYQYALYKYSYQGEVLSREKLRESVADLTGVYLMQEEDFAVFSPDRGYPGKKKMLTFLKDGVVKDSIIHPYQIGGQCFVNFYFEECQFFTYKGVDKLKCTLNDTIYRVSINPQTKKRELDVDYIFNLGQLKANKDARMEVMKDPMASPLDKMAQISILGESREFLFFSENDKPYYFYNKNNNILHKWVLYFKDKKELSEQNPAYFTPLCIDSDGYLLGTRNADDENNNPVVVIAKLKQ